MESEKVGEPGFLLRFLDGTPVSITSSKPKEISVWKIGTPDERKKYESFNPRFSTPLSTGTIVEILLSEGNEYFQIGPVLKGQEKPLSVFGKRIPKPRNLEDLRKQGLVIQPSNLPIEQN